MIHRPGKVKYRRRVLADAGALNREAKHRVHHRFLVRRHVAGLVSKVQPTGSLVRRSTHGVQVYPISHRQHLKH